MPVTIGELVEAMERLAPPDLAEEWDNTGLVLQGTRGVGRALIALDVTVDAAQHAAQGGYDALVTHHPPFIAPIKALREDDPNQHAMLLLARAGVHLYTAHTNLDSAPGGTPFALAQALGLQVVDDLPGEPACLAAFGAGAGEFADLVQKNLGGRCWHWGPGGDIDRVLLVPGSGGGYAHLAAQCNAQALLSGEIGYHDAVYWAQKGLACFAAGHDVTERPVLEILRRHLQKALHIVELDIYAAAL